MDTNLRVLFFVNTLLAIKGSWEDSVREHDLRALALKEMDIISIVHTFLEAHSALTGDGGREGFNRIKDSFLFQHKHTHTQSWNLELIYRVENIYSQLFLELKQILPTAITCPTLKWPSPWVCSPEFIDISFIEWRSYLLICWIKTQISCELKEHTKLAVVIFEQHNTSCKIYSVVDRRAAEREHRKMLHCKSQQHLLQNRNLTWGKLELLLYQFLFGLHNSGFYLFLI